MRFHSGRKESSGAELEAIPDAFWKRICLYSTLLLRTWESPNSKEIN